MNNHQAQFTKQIKNSNGGYNGGQIQQNGNIQMAVAPQSPVAVNGVDNADNDLKRDVNNDWVMAAEDAQRDAAPLQTFEKAPFDELMNQFEGTNGKPGPTIELAQAMLMTNNMKEAAANINNLQMTMAAQNNSNGFEKGSTNSTTKNVTGTSSGDKVSSVPEGVSNGAPYYYKQDYMADLTKKCASKDFHQVSKLMGNLGPSDKSTNWFLEKRNLERGNGSPGREIRDLIDKKIVDQFEYVRTKENIAQAKQRTNHMMDENLSDSAERVNGENIAEQETEVDSGQLKMNQQESDIKINEVIQKIRLNAQKYLCKSDGRDYDLMPLSQVCRKLRKNEEFMKRRDQKLLSKPEDAKKQLSVLKGELSKIEESQALQNKEILVKRIKSIESVLGLERRMRTETFNKTIAELDMKPMDSTAFDIQNVLFDYCGIKQPGNEDNDNDSLTHQKRVERLFGKIRKLPKKSCLLQNFDDKFFDPKDEKKVARSHQELVKVVGLEPELLFEKIPKYQIQVDKMPKFSNTFDSVDSVMPGIQNKNSIAGQQIINPVASHMNFNRIDGRQVISLQFNPFFINEDTEKKKIYDGYMREIIEQRDKIKNAPKEAKTKQETANIKRAWQNIVKKDIPKAYRLYQKFKADQEASNKKLSQNCLKEVRKRAVKTQRLAKESVMRARKLTKEMCHFWRKRDKEVADTKKKREKMDKEMRKRMQEEEEAMLQKKRLEYLMQQSEIYAHFMAAKLGVNEEHEAGKKSNTKSPSKYKVDIDRRAARANVAEIINENRKRLDEFDDHDRDEIDVDDLEEDKFSKHVFNQKVQKPDMFIGDLKSYQLKGLQWLDNLYDQGINGILADEMGLGKTIQTIALLAHLAEKKDVWGPFLIVVPVTTLHNWQNELTKFCPTLKVLPYFGSADERKKLAKFLDPKNLYNPAMCIHVLITSYNLISGGGKDQMKLQRVKWHYMILDEAQAIKNNNSRRWKTLLTFNTRNRLLLSGTPIQNSMAELWALLHFIMPKLFDNHEQFQEWFSKDIEQHSMDQGELNKHQLKRLHLILQPFMLRRLKKDVEQEIAPKVESTIHCEMTFRQKILYNRIKQKISTADLFQLASSKAKMENLMNLVMQFRKVCNHPDLFERRMGKSPFLFSVMQTGMCQNMSLVTAPTIYVANKNPINVIIPKLIYDECFLISDDNTRLFTKYNKGMDVSLSTVSVDTHFKLFNIFSEQNIHDQVYNQKSNVKSAFPILGLLMSSNNWGVGDLAYQAVADKMVQAVTIMHYYSRKQIRQNYFNIHQSDEDVIEIGFGKYDMVYTNKSSLRQSRFDIQVANFCARDDYQFIYRSHVVENLDLMVPGQWAILDPLVPSHPREFLNYSYKQTNLMNIYYPRVLADLANISCPSASFDRMMSSLRNNPASKKLMVGKEFKPRVETQIGKIGGDKEANDNTNQVSSIYKLFDKGILQENYALKGSCTFQLPDYSRLVTDCSKMKILYRLLAEAHKNGSRVLVFCQMTRMMDILEDFLIWQKYSYFRMDGQTQLQDRRFMVEEFQNSKVNNVFCFILSTRAGGLGINLTAADTVIFYDNDWNPTMDAQATDRAHRIGQTKTVKVYRLVTKNSVEERILKRARQKESVQDTVYSANLKADTFTSRDVLDMIIDDVEDDPLSKLGQNRNQVKGFINTGRGGVKATEGTKKKRKKKGEIAVDEPIVYESVRKNVMHKKYENEIEKLMDGEDFTNVRKKEESADVEIQDDKSSSGSDISDDEEIIQNFACAADKKRYLLKMMEKKGGASAKQVFNFEEEDAPLQIIPQEMPAKKQHDSPKRSRGRPARQQITNGAAGDEDESMDESEIEY